MKKKLKVLLHTDFSLNKTGFGRAAKCLLSYLYHTGKYELVHYCCHTPENAFQLSFTPWKSIGSVPNDELVRKIVEANNQKNDDAQRQAILAQIHYGAYKIDEVINQEKPDIYIGTQDIWGLDYVVSKDWFKKIPSVIWTTLDSLPLYPRAVELATHIQNYWMWSSFATKEMHRLGFNHVKTVHGPVEDKFFYRKEDQDRKLLRDRHGIENDRFMIGFVFRNQGRKSVINLFDGYRIWKEKNPNVKSGLLLHTSFSEGWPIMVKAKEYGVENDIYTTYVCRNCKNYKVQRFIGEAVECDKCKNKQSFFSTHLQFGVKEEELNEVYNLMDVYCHPFTSGGQEIPIQEAKFAELITLVTNYSCGEEMNDPGSGSIPLDWDKYYEFGSCFIKASTKPQSIADGLDQVYKLPLAEKRQRESQSREWALNNYAKESVGKHFEEFLDNCSPAVWENEVVESKNPNAIIPNIQNDSLWVKTLYKEILKMEVGDDDSGYLGWMHQLRNGVPRSQIEDYFRKEALNVNLSKQKRESNFEDLLSKDDEGKRLLYVMPEGIGDVVLSLGLLKSIKEQYPEYNLYFATNPENFSLLLGNPYVYRVIPYYPIMDNLLFLEGNGNHKGYFEIAFLPHINTQRMLTYIHNGKTNIAFDLIYK